MREIDILKHELEESINAYNILHKKYVESLKQQKRCITELKKIKKVLICNSIIQKGDVK